jgi:hypothetical protein
MVGGLLSLSLHATQAQQRGYDTRAHSANRTFFQQVMPMPPAHPVTAPDIDGATLRLHVAKVFLLRSGAKVGGINTRWHIASVHNEQGTRDLAVGEHVGHAMRQAHLPVAKRCEPVFAGHPPSLPQPATIRRRLAIDPLPESIFVDLIARDDNTLRAAQGGMRRTNAIGYA